MSDGYAYLTRQLRPLLQAFLVVGVQKVVLSPGSRSTPLAILLGQLEDQGKLQLYVDVDERSAAFFALGLAKTSGQPVLLVCTSGTAAANYYPAICEAKASNVPLIVLTTDRPPELQQVGAPQTLTQDYMYAQQVKAFYRLVMPQAATTPHEIKYNIYIAQKAVYQALAYPQGPVHLNLPLQKPLLPNLEVSDDSLEVRPIFTKPRTLPEPALLQQVEQYLSGKKGLLVVGPALNCATGSQVICQFAQRYHWPILADPLSGLRGQSPEVLATGDWICKNMTSLPDSYHPEVVLRLGATSVSAALSSWLAQAQITTVYLDAQHSFLDHTLQTDLVVPFAPTTVLPKLHLQKASQSWLLQWQQLDQAIQKKLRSHLSKTHTLTEPKVAFGLAQALPRDAALFVSNSMPIREIDDYFWPAAPVKLWANRGANGIDGINSTALAMATQHQPAYLYIGDLAFFHDLTGLMMGRRYQLDLTIIVQNNNGGGIFSFLPQASETSQFEKVFGTPLDLDIAAIARLYQAKYCQITTYNQLTSALHGPVKGLTILEVVTQRATLVSFEQQLAQQVTHVIKDLPHAN